MAVPEAMHSRCPVAPQSQGMPAASAQWTCPMWPASMCAPSMMCSPPTKAPPTPVPIPTTMELA